MTDTPTDTDTPVHNPSTNTAADHVDPPDTDAELARWKALSRQHEDRAKVNASAAKELATLKAASMSELERAVTEAKVTARAEVLREVGAARVDDAVRVATAGRPVDVDALLEGVDRTRFLTDNAEPDVTAIRKWVDRIAPAVEPGGTQVPRIPTGPRGPSNLNGAPAQQFADFLSGQLRSG